jgi:hypothetical protein
MHCIQVKLQMVQSIVASTVPKLGRGMDWLHCYLEESNPLLGALPRHPYAMRLHRRKQHQNGFNTQLTSIAGSRNKERFARGVPA